MTPPRDRSQALAQPPPANQPKVLRLPPQATAALPPLPEETGERAINVIQLETKGKEKAKEPEVMPVKKARVKKTRVSEEVTRPTASMEIEEEGTSGKEKESKHTKKDFPLDSKEEPYEMVADVSS